MDKKKAIYTKSFILIGCALAIWLGSWTDAANKRYEIHPDLGMESPQTNTVMVLDAYERLMDNYMSLVQSNLNAMSGDMTQATKQLGSIDRKLDNLAVRIAQIERALNLPPGPVPGHSAPSRLY